MINNRYIEGLTRELPVVIGLGLGIRLHPELGPRSDTLDRLHGWGSLTIATRQAELLLLSLPVSLVLYVEILGDDWRISLPELTESLEEMCKFMESRALIMCEEALMGDCPCLPRYEQTSGF